MSDFKGRHFGGEIVLWAVRWYCRYPISYRDLETMNQGSTRLVKRSTNNEARDDIASALLLAAGSFVRSPPCLGGGCD